MAVNWAPVGQQLAKQQVAEQAAFDTRLGQRIARGRQEEDLKQELMKTQALQGVEAALAASGRSPEEARLGALAAQGGFGSDLSAVGQYVLRNQEAKFRQDAVDAAVAAGAPGAGNVHLVGVATGPIKTTDITQGQAFNPYGDSSQVVHLTDIGKAAVRADDARAEQARAGAAENYAQAAAAGRPKSGGAGKGDKFSAPSQASVQASFTNSDGTFNRKAYANFQQWRARHPGLPDGDEALTAFFGAGGRDIPDRKGTPMPPNLDAPPEGTMVDQVGLLERELGRALTPAEIDALDNGTFSAVIPPAGAKRINPADFDSSIATTETRDLGGGVTVSGNAGPLPPAARAKLRRGTNTRFANGEVWTLTPEGEPTRVK